ncbi:hypothetical protein [Micromonospora sp. NPDC050200]|uniref:hypothetical protein n=1 Tax=Micromonospora sp. NPDC050200 TaxID=3155664 RepID=UPI0033C043FB
MKALLRRHRVRPEPGRRGGPGGWPPDLPQAVRALGAATATAGSAVLPRVR